MLAVEDPNEPENDLAKGSYNIPRVRQAFEFAYSQARHSSAAAPPPPSRTAESCQGLGWRARCISPGSPAPTRTRCAEWGLCQSGRWAGSALFAASQDGFLAAEATNL